MFLSIIIPVYNAEKYLSACLDSVYNQSFSESEYEIICVNDGSKDGSAEILESYKLSHSNMTVIHKANEGCSAARNDGMNQAKGEYFWFIDNDDLIAENILSEIKKAIVENGDYDMYQFPYQSFTYSDLDNTGKVIIRDDYVKSGGMIGNALWPQIFKRDFLKKHNLYHRGSRKDKPFYGFGMDALFIYECIRKGMRIKKIFEDKPIYFYRKSENTITTDYSLTAAMAKVNEYLDIIPILTEYYEEDKWSECAEYTANTMMDYVRTLMRNIAELPLKYYWHYKKILHEKELLPFVQPQECSYSMNQFIAGRTGMDKLRGKLFYYSISSMGLNCYFIINRVIFVHNKLKSKVKLIIRKLIHK